MSCSIGTGWTPNLVGAIDIDLNPNLQSGNDGDLVALVNNQAPNKIVQDYSWKQATGANKPVLKRNAMNGQSVFRFDGVASYLLSNSAGLTVNSSGYTSFLVHKLNGAGSGWLSTITDELGTFHFDAVVVAGGYQPYTFQSKSPPGGSIGVGIANALDTNPHIFMRTYNGGTITAPASYSAAMDGVAATVNVSGAVGLTAAHKNSLGANVDFSGTPSTFCAMDLARWIIFKSVLSAGDILNVTNNLRRIYGTP